MKSIIALYTANAREFGRDRMASLFTILIPIMFAAFFGVVFSGGGNGFKLQMGLVVEDAGATGQQLAGALTSVETQGMLGVRVGSREESLASLRKGDVQVVLVLPNTLTQSAAAGQPAPVEVFYDAASQTSAGTGLGIARSLLAQANLTVRGLQPLLIPEEHAIQTNPLRAVDFFVPSTLAMAMLWLGLFGTMLPIVQQREQQVLRRLSVSPVRRFNLLAGQVLWRLTVGIVQASAFMLVGIFVLKVHMQGNWLLFALSAVLGALVFISMGYLLAGISRTTEGATAMAQLVNFPMMFLSGIFFEASILPAFLRPVMNVMPATYLADAFRQIMVGYSALYPLWLDFAVLSGWLIVFVVLSLRFFRWEQP